MAYDKGRTERRNLVPVIGSDKSLCSRAQILSAPTTLPLFWGHWDPARATSCQFDAAPGARRDARIRAELSPCQKNVRPRLRERCRLPRRRCFHQMRFISRGLRNTFRGIQGSEVTKAVFTHLDLRYSCLTSEKQVTFFICHRCST